MWSYKLQWLNNHNRLFCFTLIGVQGSRLSPLEQCQLIIIFSMAQKTNVARSHHLALLACHRFYHCATSYPPSRLGINQNHPLNGILFTLCSQYDYEYDTTEMMSEVGWCLACFETQWHKKEEEMVEKRTQNCHKSTDIKHLQKQMIKYPMIHKVM